MIHCLIVWTIVLGPFTAAGQETWSESPFDPFPSTPKATSAVLKQTIVKSDFVSQVKVLPEQQDIVFQLQYGKDIKLLFPLARPGPISLSISPCFGGLKWTLYWRPYTADTFDSSPVDGGKHSYISVGESNDSFPQGNENKDLGFPDHRFRLKRFLKTLEKGIRKKRQYKSSVVEGNFSTPDVKNPHLRFVFRGDRPILEMELTFGGGKEPWQYIREIAKPGLYILKVQSTSQNSKFHALASRYPDVGGEDKPELKTFNSKDHSKRHSITLAWSGSNGNHQEKFCLVVSRQKLYSSMCAAKELQNDWRKAPTASPDTSLILGCTSNSHYTFPATSHAIYFVTVWMHGTLIPYVQAIIKAKPFRRIPRLKPGVMVPFTLTAGGKAVAEFNVRKAGKKLHVAVVSCSGGVKVLVMAGKEKVASANGREALHLAVRRPPKAKLTIVVSPVPPLQSLYRVQIVAAHSARMLPVPRLPRNVTVESEAINCTSARVRWTKSPRTSIYCIIFRRHPSGRPPEIRPPIQCGWEHVIKRHEYFDVLECVNATKGFQQERIIKNLESNSSFLVNVLVRHPITEKTLALASSMLNLPSCSSHNDVT